MEGRRFAVVAVDAPGVRLQDDWDGFRQRLTGTGTARAARRDAAVTSAEATGADRPGFAGPLPDAFAWAEVAVEHAQVTVPDLAIAAAQELFLTGGASNTFVAKGLDRHWRNAQTVATHNPIAFRARAIGDYWINGTVPEGLNAIGTAPSAVATQEIR